jgi:putative phage-type endonuclease
MSSIIKETLRDSYEEFLEERKRGIGGSDASVVCRSNKWRDPVDLFKEKTGKAEPIPDNISMKRGRYYEQGALDLYEDLTGFKLSENPGLIKHPEYEFLIAHVDGIVIGSHIVEIKILSRPNFDDWIEPVGDGFDEKESIPIAYYYQIMHYLMCTGLNEAHVLADLARNVFIYKFKRDHGFIARMRCKEIIFWDLVQRGVPPEGMTTEEIAKLNNLDPKRKTDKMSEADVESVAIASEIRELKDDIKKLKSKQKEGEDFLARKIKGTSGLKITDQMGSVRKLATFNADKNGRHTLRAYG